MIEESGHDLLLHQTQFHIKDVKSDDFIETPVESSTDRYHGSLSSRAPSETQEILIIENSEQEPQLSAREIYLNDLIAKVARF